MARDITILGSGAAGTLTLIEIYKSLLAAGNRAQPVQIAIVEKSGEFWKGIPYGRRSSVNALTITSVLDFINEKERPAFFAWLKANKEAWAAWCSQHGGLTAARWLANNLPLVEQDDWATVYVPRFIYGNYLAEQVTTLQEQVESKRLAQTELIHAEATSTRQLPDSSYQVTLENAEESTTTLVTKKLVIATGSAPMRTLSDLNGAVWNINDIYEPSVPDNIQKVQAALTLTPNAEERNILIIGSNASSIEFLYIMEGMPELRALINKIVIISTSGMLPYHISTEQLPHHPLPALDKIKEAGSYDIQTLVDAAMEDLKLALVNGANMDYVATLVTTTLQLMEPLGEQAKKEFFAIHGVRLRDRFRRSGPEYKGAAQVLIDAGVVSIIQGRFIDLHPSAAGAVMEYQDTASGAMEKYPLTFKAVINCSGSDDLGRSSSRLLYDMVSNNICRMNLSRKGIEVNEHFEAAPNLYIMGPLLGGNMNKLIHFWQLENASRLTYLAPYLAQELLA